jgi:uncharacterized protein involved in cysteine biosynthesis
MRHYLKALGQFISDPRLWWVVVQCFGLSLVCFILLWMGFGWFLQFWAEKSPWASKFLVWGGWLASFVGTLFLFPALFGVIGGLFYEKVSDAVDARHYAFLPPADGPTLKAALGAGVKYFVLMIAINALALPVYIGLLVFLGSGAGIFILVNGLLFGREHWDAVALRRYAPTEARRHRQQQRGALFLQGCLTALLSLVPILNFVVPLFGIAAMTHLVNASIPPPAPVPPSLPPRLDA